MADISALRRASSEGRLCLRKGHGHLSSGTVVRLESETARGFMVRSFGSDPNEVEVPESDLMVKRNRANDRPEIESIRKGRK